MKKNVLTKVIACAAVAFLGESLFAEGFTAGGYIRSGVETDLEDTVFQTTSYKDGFFYGNGSSRIRLNFGYETENAGMTFRYQASDWGFGEKAENSTFFSEGNIKWAMGYAKFCDGKIIAEAGKLSDNYTATTGYEGFAFDGTYGARAVFLPVEGLAITAQGSTLHLGKYDDDEGDKAGKYEFDYRVFSASAAYSNDDIAIAGGFHFAGDAYASFGLKSVAGLTLQLEGKFLHETLSDSGKDTVTLVEDVEYDFTEKLHAGIVAYQDFWDGNSKEQFYPFARFMITDAFATTLEASFVHYDYDDAPDDDFTLTPSISFFADKAEVKIYYTFDKEGHDALGAGLIYSF